MKMDNPKMSDRAKRLTLMAMDAITLPAALWIAVTLRYGEVDVDMMAFWWVFPVVSVCGLCSFYCFDLYRAIVRYIGPSSMLPVFKGVTIAALAASLTAYLTGAVTFPRSAPIIFWFIAILMIGGGRVAVRAYFYGLFNNYLLREPVAIYGAGDAGAQLAVTLLSGTEYMPVAFLDDDKSLRKRTIHGIRVYGTNKLATLIPALGVKRILLAMPSLSTSQRTRVLNNLTELPVEIHTVPHMREILAGAATVGEVKSIDLADLLGRDVVPPDEGLLADAIGGRNILVTGAAGTIGSELCRKILKREPRCLVVFDNSEYGLYNIEAELQELCSERTEIVFLLGSILNRGHLDDVLSTFEINTVYHAAAYKHVPLVEQNIIEGVRNNVVGTWQVASAVADSKAEELVMISSDKAVRPTNVMGASKRMAELIIQGFAAKSAETASRKTYCMVRFGNVLRSSGSVVPLFESQITSGGPVTVTHPDASRYFMTCDEAAELVVQAGAMAEGGEIFVLDMGQPVLIRDLAEKMIHLSGHKVGEEAPSEPESIEIDYIGLRPGEKLTEELVIGEQITGTRHPKIMRANEDGLDWVELESVCSELVGASARADYRMVQQLLEAHVAGYKLADSTVDPALARLQSRDGLGNVTPLKR